ncbi:putative Charged multivesicular body protein 2a [Tripterygium wilfordii]|uniref:Putative Charged multivesicular body protein 2a n=1 Tax=Tripterygium wilfordii TaxID=458696 RepID=A0A7J7DAH6_TRIWF|nr:putative Charged multivesicular body protein 2a [Tripterygium wilfordii]
MVMIQIHSNYSVACLYQLMFFYFCIPNELMVLVSELLRENKRMLDKSIREIERERQGLQTQEKKLISEIKKSAKQGQMGAVKVMAKDLIRTRHQIEKFYKLKSQLQGVSLRIQTLKSTQAMGEAMKGVTKAMGQMNRQMNLPSLQKIMQEFERQNERMEMTTEVMGDAIDDALEGDEEEEETEELVSQVLDEIGIDINQEVVSTLTMDREFIDLVVKLLLCK